MREKSSNIGSIIKPRDYTERKVLHDNYSRTIYRLGKARGEICQVGALAVPPLLPSTLIFINSEAMGPKKKFFRRTMSTARRRVGPPLRGQAEWP